MQTMINWVHLIKKDWGREKRNYRGLLTFFIIFSSIEFVYLFMPIYYTLCSTVQYLHLQSNLFSVTPVSTNFFPPLKCVLNSFPRKYKFYTYRLLTICLWSSNLRNEFKITRAYFYLYIISIHKILLNLKLIYFPYIFYSHTSSTTFLVQVRIFWRFCSVYLFDWKYFSFSMIHVHD